MERIVSSARAMLASSAVCLVAACGSGDGETGSHFNSGAIATAGSETSPKNVITKIDRQDKVARFFYRHKGRLLAYEPMYDGEIYATARPEGGWSLTYEGVRVGSFQDGRLTLCPPRSPHSEKDFPCDAEFHNNHEHPAPEPSGRYTERYTMDLSLALIPKAVVPPEKRGLARRKINLSRYAQNQINQNATGTCYYNSVTGLLEMLHEMDTGRPVDLSEPDVLGQLSFRSRAERKYLAMDAANRLSEVVSDRVMPVERYYGKGADFKTARKKAKRDGHRYRNNGRGLRTLPFTTKSKKLFWFGRWNEGHVTEKHFDRTIRWLRMNRSPVHLQHVIGGYWHAVILMGHDPATDRVLIKDSLGNTHLKGTWKSKRWFKRWVYGAVGVKLR